MPPELTSVRRGARVRRGRKAWGVRCSCAAGSEEGTKVLLFRPVARLALRPWARGGAAAAESVPFPTCTSTANGRRRGCRALRGQCSPRRQASRQTVPAVAAVAPAPRDRGAPVAWSSAFEAGVPEEDFGACVHSPVPSSATPFSAGREPAADSAPTGEEGERGSRERGPRRLKGRGPGRSVRLLARQRA